MDSLSYKKGFEDALDCVLKILQEDREAAFGEIFQLATTVRLEKAGEILQAIHGP